MLARRITQADEQVEPKEVRRYLNCGQQRRCVVQVRCHESGFVQEPCVEYAPPGALAIVRDSAGARPGEAIGVNLPPSFCGLFGPNRNYTSFSTGMNQTARLQSLGAFRETLVMDSAMKAIATSNDPALAGLKFGPLVETPVKNVAQPLRYYKLLE